MARWPWRTSDGAIPGAAVRERAAAAAAWWAGAAVVVVLLCYLPAINTPFFYVDDP